MFQVSQLQFALGIVPAPNLQMLFTLLLFADTRQRQAYYLVRLSAVIVPMLIGHCFPVKAIGEVYDSERFATAAKVAFECLGSARSGDYCS
jgi:hypothetical protein